MQGKVAAAEGIEEKEEKFSSSSGQIFPGC